MKRFAAMVIALVMVFAFGSVAMAAVSPEVEKIAVTDPSPLGEKALEAGVYNVLAGRIPQGKVPVKVATFAYNGEGKLEVKVPGLKAGDTVYVLFRGVDGTIKILESTLKDGVVSFWSAGEGDYMVVKVVSYADANASNIIPRTGDNNRLMKLALVGVAAIAVMALAGVAIKRNSFNF